MLLGLVALALPMQACLAAAANPLSGPTQPTTVGASLLSSGFSYNGTKGPLPFNLSGTWQDSKGDNISLSLSSDYPCESNATNCSQYYVTSEVLSDPSCPSAVGQFYITGSLNSTGGFSSSKDGIQLCTSATNPVVADCGQARLWITNFNATVGENAIVGDYESQYWNYNTTSSGSVVPNSCVLSYNFPQPFILTRVAASTSTSSTTSQSAPPPLPGDQQTSGSQTSYQGGASRTTSTTATTSSTSSPTATPGPMGYEVVVVAGVVVVVLAAVSWLVIRKRV